MKEEIRTLDNQIKKEIQALDSRVDDKIRIFEKQVKEANKRPSHRNECHEVTSMAVKGATKRVVPSLFSPFDGKMSLPNYLMQFEAVARANRWTKSSCFNRCVT